MLLTISLESEKEVFVLPATSIAVGGKEGPWGEVSEPKHCSVSLENHAEQSLFPFRYNNELVCCYFITQLTTSPEKQQSCLSLLGLLAALGVIKMVNFPLKKMSFCIGSWLANTHATGVTRECRHHAGAAIQCSQTSGDLSHYFAVLLVWFDKCLFPILTSLDCPSPSVCHTHSRLSLLLCQHSCLSKKPAQEPKQLKNYCAFVAPLGQLVLRQICFLNCLPSKSTQYFFSSTGESGKARMDV